MSAYPKTNSDFCSQSEIKHIMIKRLGIIAVFIFTVVFVFSQSPSGKYFVFLNPNPSRPEISEAEVDAIQAAHMANMDSLAKKMLLLAAGPFHGGGGVQVLVASTLQEAQTMVESDPAVRAKRFNTEIYPLEMKVGGICPLGDTYEMIEYQFVRIVPIKDKVATESQKKLEKLTSRHVSYVKTNYFKQGLISDGSFGFDKGGFMVAFKSGEEEFDKFLKYDPMIRSEMFEADIKIIWIGQGTFCERSQK